ncbi:uncharacterized protein BJ212DRAFT_1297348 [Suillus subaureus]|uniref:Uncharacterized protein n=1 Tax=Suillus subaureus TaxID=48587 RepID=A0A9P7EGP3_9AGAM|nr:uncharacterized protein BJ212DRAFT_1297348 [Suillus subaureus]KAG1820847.1 hypothetical protein BJ212DRAFT_1297348 [Suillus subaureus]
MILPRSQVVQMRVWAVELVLMMWMWVQAEAEQLVMKMILLRSWVVWMWVWATKLEPMMWMQVQAEAANLRPGTSSWKHIGASAYATLNLDGSQCLIQTFQSGPDVLGYSPCRVASCSSQGAIAGGAVMACDGEVHAREANAGEVHGGEASAGDAHAGEVVRKTDLCAQADILISLEIVGFISYHTSASIIFDDQKLEFIKLVINNIKFRLLLRTDDCEMGSIFRCLLLIIVDHCFISSISQAEVSTQAHLCSCAASLYASTQWTPSRLNDLMPHEKMFKF